MAEIGTLSKVLHVRENEKKVVQKAYKDAIDSFETVATELYYVLKQKEEAEKRYDQYIQSSVAIEKVIQTMDYINELNGQIMELQSKVHIARNNMESKQLQLSDAYVEVKKYEKIIEHINKENMDEKKRRESAFMDEISMFQYLRHKSR